MKPGDRATLTIPKSDDYTDELTIEGEYVKKGKILGFVGEESGEGVVFRVEKWRGGDVRPLHPSTPPPLHVTSSSRPCRSRTSSAITTTSNPNEGT